jgi:hypothetical protein
VIAQVYRYGQKKKPKRSIEITESVAIWRPLVFGRSIVALVIF